MTLIEVKPGLKFSRAALKKVLPDVETALFFAKLYKLDSRELGVLLNVLFQTTIMQALTGEGGSHSSDLQDYVVELGYEYLINEGAVVMNPDIPTGQVLPELWKDLEVTIASSIQEVANKIKDVVGHMPGKQGEMIFKSLMVVNAKRPILGDYKAAIHHAPAAPNLVVLDVSGSMSENTIRTIVDDVVALSYMANAHLAIVSETATWWQPGEFSTDSVLGCAEYGGTHYETLRPLFEREKWGVVVTIADYDSSPAAKSAIRDCGGSIERVLDISLVSRPTYLSEVLGQLAQEVRPLLVAGEYSYLT